MMDLPKDPFILMSYINQQLRDNGISFEEFCKSSGVDKSELTGTLKAAGFEYDEHVNKFW